MYRPLFSFPLERGCRLPRLSVFCPRIGKEEVFFHGEAVLLVTGSSLLTLKLNSHKYRVTIENDKGGKIDETRESRSVDTIQVFLPLEEGDVITAIDSMSHPNNPEAAILFVAGFSPKTGMKKWIRWYGVRGGSGSSGSSGTTASASSASSGTPSSASSASSTGRTWGSTEISSKIRDEMFTAVEYEVIRVWHRWTSTGTKDTTPASALPPDLSVYVVGDDGGIRRFLFDESTSSFELMVGSFPFLGVATLPPKVWPTCMSRTHIEKKGWTAMGFPNGTVRVYSQDSDGEEAEEEGIYLFDGPISSIAWACGSPYDKMEEPDWIDTHHRERRWSGFNPETPSVRSRIWQQFGLVPSHSGPQNSSAFLVVGTMGAGAKLLEVPLIKNTATRPMSKDGCSSIHESEEDSSVTMSGMEHVNVIHTVHTFPRLVKCDAVTAVYVGDIDADGVFEIFVGTYRGMIFVFRLFLKEGEEKEVELECVWERNFHAPIYEIAAVDVIQDGICEVVVLCADYAHILVMEDRSVGERLREKKALLERLRLLKMAFEFLDTPS